MTRILAPDKTVFVLKWDPGYSAKPDNIIPFDTTASGITVRNVITDDNDHVMKYTHSFVGLHCDDDIMDAIASQITSLTIVYSTVYSEADQRKHPVNSPHKWPVTRKMFPFDDVIMIKAYILWYKSLHLIRWSLYWNGSLDILSQTQVISCQLIPRRLALLYAISSRVITAMWDLRNIRCNMQTAL